MKAEFGPVSQTARDIVNAAIHDAPPVAAPRPTPVREEDVGAVITRQQMDEYRDAAEAKAQGRESPRLVVAAFICRVLIIGAVVAVLVLTLL